MLLADRLAHVVPHAVGALAAFQRLGTEAGALIVVAGIGPLDPVPLQQPAFNSVQDTLVFAGTFAGLGCCGCGGIALDAIRYSGFA